MRWKDVFALEIRGELSSSSFLVSVSFLNLQTLSLKLQSDCGMHGSTVCTRAV